MLRLWLIINALQLLLVEVWSVAINEKIIAHVQEYPFVVSIQYMNQDPWENSHCTGMVLSGWWVSTSCLCLRKLSRKEPSSIAPPHKFRIIAATNINSGTTGKLRFPVNIRVHDRCNIWDKTYDFAAMSITYRFLDNDFRIGVIAVLPVSSSDSYIISRGLEEIINRKLRCTVVGWVGNSSILGSPNLLTIEMQIVDERTCTVILCTMAPSVCKKEPVLRADQRGLICAKAKYATPCEGFQGAPLVCGSNVWATATLVNRCSDELVTYNFAIFTRIDVGYDFLRHYASSTGLLQPSPQDWILSICVLVTSVCNIINQKNGFEVGVNIGLGIFG